MTSEGLMTSKGTEASAPDVPPDEGVRREPRKGRLPNGYMFIHLLEPPIWFYFTLRVFLLIHLSHASGG